MSKHLLSIGMIVKDEIRSIEKCLQALQPLRDTYPCELVIADTGSSDGTKEVAAQYADVLFDFEWVNDFSAARNAVIDHCSGTWVLMVDADEYLDADLSGFQSLFQKDPKDWPDICGITQRNYSSRDLEHSDYSDFVALRMFQPGRGIRYQGEIHESLYKESDSNIKAMVFSPIILHHDGYAFQSEEEKRKKCERNLTLLDKALTRDPNDVRRLVQYLESARIFPPRLAQCAVHGMELLQEPNRKPVEAWDGCLAARCGESAIIAALPQADDWTDWCFEHYPDHPAVQVDLAYAAILRYSEMRQYEKVLPMAQCYLKTLENQAAGNLPLVYQITTSFQNAAEDKHRQVLILLSQALVKTGRPNDALPVLSKWPLERLQAKIVLDWLRALALLEDFPKAANEMTRALPLLEPEKNDSWQKERWRSVSTLLRQFFQPGWGASEDVVHPWKLLLNCDGPLGQAARIMDCNDTSTAEQLLSQVEEWDDFPPGALLHTLLLGAGLPPVLCRQRPELRLQLLADAGRGDSEFARHMASYVWKQAEALPDLQMQFDLAVCALQSVGNLDVMMDAPMLCRTLCDKLIELANALLPRLYRPELITCQEEWNALPGAHQFCLWLLEGVQCKARGDLAGYLRALRLGLRQAPRMKELVEFLLDEAETETPPTRTISDNPELLALADQVRNVLSQFSPDDPAVIALKQSEVYQKVAYLIEGVDAPTFGGLSQ